MELLTLSVPIQAALTYTEEEGLQFRWDVRVDLDADWLAGNIEVVASAFGQERYRKPLVEWEGFHISTTHMSNGAGDIFPGKPGTCGDSETMDELVRDDDAPGALLMVGSDEDASGNPAAAMLTASAVDWRQAPLTQSFLAQDMHEDPATIPMVGALARDVDSEAMVMVGALEEAAGPQAQQELRGLVLAEDVEGAVRRRATVALGRVPQPTDETIDLLQERFAADEGDLRTIAGYALGTALSARRPYDPEATDARIAELEAAYVSAPDTDARVLMLQILGNVGAHRTLPLLATELGHEDPEIRAAAVMALRHVGGDEADALLEQTMRGDSSADVREAAIRAADQRDTPAATRAIADWIASEPDGWVQVTALHALGRAVTRSEDAARALRTIEANAPMGQMGKVARNYLNRLDAEVE
jgi:HEAT repeat protein